MRDRHHSNNSNERDEDPLAPDLIDLNSPIEEVPVSGQMGNEPPPTEDDGNQDPVIPSWLKWVIFPLNKEFFVLSYILPKRVRRAIKKVVNEILGD